MALHDGRRHVPSGPQAIAGQAVGEGQVEHDRDGRSPGRRRSPDEVPARGGLDVRGVDHGRPARGQAPLEGGVQGSECPPADRLVRLAMPQRAPGTRRTTGSPRARSGGPRRSTCPSPRHPPGRRRTGRGSPGQSSSADDGVPIWASAAKMTTDDIAGVARDARRGRARQGTRHRRCSRRTGG